MKKIKQLLTIAILAFTFSNCGTSVKVTDAWKADNIITLKDAKLLVIGRSDDMISRQRFEQEIADKLRSNGIDATESYKKFPSLNHNVKHTEESIDEVVSIIKNEGFKGVVLTVLKDKTKEIVTSETGGYMSGGYYPSHYGGYYGGFGGYYGSVYSPYGYGYGGSYVPSETRTYTSETYSLETVIYNLDLEKGKQLVGVVSVDITDPKSASKVAPKYAEKVWKQFEK
ncbi:MAG: hypothetical protein L3J34_12660 [Flavobacteriaceae bacterium]|nr:hypothetical protein [Flavobacteriaceae bacterium]